MIRYHISPSFLIKKRSYRHQRHLWTQSGAMAQNWDFSPIQLKGTLKWISFGSEKVFFFHAGLKEGKERGTGSLLLLLWHYDLYINKYKVAAGWEKRVRERVWNLKCWYISKGGWGAAVAPTLLWSLWNIQEDSSSTRDFLAARA